MVEKTTIGRKGVTLLELVVAIAIMTVVVGLTVPPFIKFYKRQKLEGYATTFLEDLKRARQEAISQGPVGIDDRDPTNVVVLQRRVYVAIDSEKNVYKVFRWQDADRDGIPEAGEFSSDFRGGDDSPFIVNNFGKLRVGLLDGINKQACTNSDGTPSDSLTNLTRCPDIGPKVFTGSMDCLRFNSKGFSEARNNAKIYLTDGENSYAVEVRITGLIMLCRWDPAKKRWMRLE